VALGEGVGDVLEEDQPQHDVLVLGRIHVGAQGVGGPPEFGFEAEVRSVTVFFDHVKSPLRLRIPAIRFILHPNPFPATGLHPISEQLEPFMIPLAFL